MELISRLFSPVKMLSRLILRHPVTTANARLSLVFRADSNRERIMPVIFS